MANAPKNEQPQVKIVDPTEKWLKALNDCVMALEGVQPETRNAVFCFLRSKYRNDWPSDSY